MSNFLVFKNEVPKLAKLKQNYLKIVRICESKIK